MSEVPQIKGQLFFFKLGDIRNPEAWKEANKRAHNKEVRYQRRLNLKAQVEADPKFTTMADDQIVFVEQNGDLLNLVAGSYQSSTNLVTAEYVLNYIPEKGIQIKVGDDVFYQDADGVVHKAKPRKPKAE